MLKTTAPPDANSMGPIEQQRTEAIWSLSKLLSPEDHRVGRGLLDAHAGRNSLINALALAVTCQKTVGNGHV
jgi:hypothetical protein